jgi:ribosomal-protein-alanine N-acetyltransferase
MVDIACSNCLLRPLPPSDAQTIAPHANHHGVWANLRDRFPHTYTVPDAEALSFT